jgi:4-hydroxy-2-oxoheptanedioate aldolase
MKSLRARVRRGETLFGCFLGMGSSLIAEIVGQIGYDYVVIDLEHGAGFECHLLEQLQALEHTSTASIVRIESSDRPRFHRVLDLGAEGVMIPRTDSLEQAKTAAAGLLYPPQGMRGIAKMTRATSYGANFDQYFSQANETILGVLQIESEASLQQVDAIAALDGVDVLFIGPRDLTQSLGVSGQFDHPKYREALRMTADAALRHKKAAGILVGRHEELTDVYRLGYRFLACGSDVEYVSRGAQAMLASMQAAVPQK